MASTPHRVTLEDVARMAGVSTATVSRHLSGTHRVADDKARAIAHSIQRLNYHPNLVARGLAKGRTMTVGVLTQEISSSFFNEAMRGVEDGLLGHHYDAIFVSGHWDAADEAQRLASLIGRRVDGVILILAGLDDKVLAHHAARLPVVLMGRRSSAARVHSLAFDHYQGACQAMQHLVDQGHRRIAFIGGPPGREDAEDRLRAYRDVLLRAGVAFDERLTAPGHYVESGGVSAMNLLLDRGLPFSAVFAANDDSAYGAMLALLRRGFRVPEDISLVGYDDLPHSAFSLPPLSSVRQPLRELGRDAANAVVALIEGRKPPRSAPARLELVVRESTRAWPAGHAAATAAAAKRRKR